MSSKSLVILGSPGPTNAILFNHLRPRFEITRVVVERRLSRLVVLKKRIRKLGLVATLSQVAFRSGIVPLLSMAAWKRLRKIATEHNLSLRPTPQALVTKIDSANSPACLELLKTLNPAIVIVNGTRILSPGVLASVPAKFINLHAGITPRYRGVHGAYWALAEGRRDLCGVTVHMVDAGIDTGPALAQARIEPTSADNFATYQLLQTAACLPLLDALLPRMLSGEEIVPLQSNDDSKLWSHPTVGQYLRNRALRGVK